MVPAVSEDRLVIYEADGLTELPEVLGREDFVGFAKAAYWSDDATAPVLVELAATWFARSLTVGEQPVADHAERLEQLIQQTRLEGIQGEEQAEERLQIRLRLLAEAKTEAPRDRYLSLPKPDPNLAPSPRELHELLVRGDEPSTVHDRTLANFQAIAALLDKPKAGRSRHADSLHGLGRTVGGRRQELSAQGAGPRREGRAPRILHADGSGAGSGAPAQAPHRAASSAPRGGAGVRAVGGHRQAAQRFFDTWL
jgi:hypothetical protein